MAAISHITIQHERAKHTSDCDCILICAIKAGCKTALEQLYDRHCGHIFALCSHLTHTAPEAEDLTITAFKHLWRLRHHLAANQCDALPLLKAIAISHLGRQIFEVPR